MLQNMFWSWIKIEVEGFFVFDCHLYGIFSFRDKECPAGLEHPTRASNRRKAAVKLPATSHSSHHPKKTFLQIKFKPSKMAALSNSRWRNHK